MSSVIPRIIISLSMIVGQTLTISAYAASFESQSPEVVALVQPHASQSPSSQSAISEQGHLVEISNRLIPGASIYSAYFSGDEAGRLAKEGVLIGPDSSSHYIDLQGGNILLSPEQDIVVATKSGKIYIKAGAIVFVVNSGPDLVVYDLLQTKPKQVSVAIDKHRLSVEPGRMLVLTQQAIDDFEKLEIDCHRVSYRNAQVLNRSGQVKSFAADFSIASAMTTIQPLKKLTYSNNGQDKLALEKLVKGALLLGGFASDTDQAFASDYALSSAKPDDIQVASVHNQ